MPGRVVRDDKMLRKGFKVAGKCFLFQYAGKYSEEDGITEHRYCEF